ncbi:Calmodulin [Aphelenchoides fujianensis]|nr:Calmodulin [Aphelenchoides fujianensis]
MSVCDFTEKQVNGIKEVFDSFDKTGDGTLTGGHLGVVIRSLGYILTQKEWGALVDATDTLDGGRVEFNKFLVLLHSQATTSRRSRTRRRRSIFDVEGKSAIPLAAFRHIMTNTGECLSNAEIDELLKSVAVKAESPFNISGIYQSFVVGLAWKWTFLSAVAVFLQFVGSTPGMLAAVVVYADLAFPLVMRAFAAIFARIRVD